MNSQVFFGIFAICVGFCFTVDSVPIPSTTDSPTNGTTEFLNPTIQELVEDQDGTANIVEASEKGSLAGVKYWYRQVPSSINERDRGNFTSLHLASEKGHLAIVQFLLSKGAEVDPVTSGNTPLLLASFWGHVPVVEALLDKGANINHQNLFNFTPLHTAVLNEKLSLVKVLINRGADRSLRDKINRTPLDLAIIVGEPIEDYLLSLKQPDK